MPSPRAEPTGLWNVTFGNGDKYGAARFGSQRSATGQQLLFVYVITDGKQIAARVIEQAEIHLLGHFFGLASEQKQFFAEGSGANAALLNGAARP